MLHDHVSERETVANQIYDLATMTKMIAKCTQGGESIDKAIGWAASELEGSCAPEAGRVRLRSGRHRSETALPVGVDLRSAQPRGVRSNG